MHVVLLTWWIYWTILWFYLFFVFKSILLYKNSITNPFRTVPNHSEGRVDAEHSLVKKAINADIKRRLDIDKDYLVPKTAKELVELCNETESISTPRKQKILKKRKFFWVRESDLTQFSSETGVFVDSKGQRYDSLPGISNCYKFEVKDKRINMFDHIDSRSVWKSFTCEC